jgi:hypothetical protein
MTGLTILLIVGCAAIAVLLACLKGFSQARRHKKVEGIFVGLEKSKESLSERRNSRLIGSPQRKGEPHREAAARQVSSSTAALVEMAIILGSRSLSCDARSGPADPKGARPRYGAKPVRLRTNDPQTRVQPLNNS